MLLACGCSAGPAERSRERVWFEEWSYDDFDGVTVRTTHYRIHSTIPDQAVLARLARVMEGSLRQYQQFAPGVRLSTRPMDCFIFASRAEWARFTQDHTGDDATVYLQINRGGYTIRDWYVAYFIGDLGTYAVAAHEGWHQYVARHFKSRLPPFLEEGIASMFESIAWDGEQPHWTIGANRIRADKLSRALHHNDLWPLEKLITLHAGDVVGLSGERIETFYAQNWAFAMFLWEADNGRHRTALRRMLSDLAAGTAPSAANVAPTSSQKWDPRSAGPLLEHYLGIRLDQVQREYDKYIRRLVKDRWREMATRGWNDDS